MANSSELDLDELAHNQPSHLDPHCLLSSTHSNSESDYVSYSKADHHGMEWKGWKAIFTKPSVQPGLFVPVVKKCCNGFV